MEENLRGKLLAIGDVHLGTRPSRLPADLAGAGIEPAGLTPAAALADAVDLAISESVDAVLFAGDVVESTNARFEAMRPLEDAIRRLNQAAIPVFGVAGNHDVDALPRLANRIEGFTLIGSRGQWEAVSIKKEGRPLVELIGWSFPTSRYTTSPVAEWLSAPLPAQHTGLPRVGLLHADLDASGGPYAPIRRQELADSGLSAWLLGHIHKPSLQQSIDAGAPNPCGYLGSLVGLDPSETGPHGPWLIEITADGRLQPAQIPMAPLRWEHLDVPVAAGNSSEDIGDRLFDVIENEARRIHASDSHPRVLGLRLRLVGASAQTEDIDRWLSRQDWAQVSRRVGDTLVFLDKVSSALTLALDLDELATGDDPLALLAGKLRVLETGGEPAEALLQEARQALRPMATDNRWSPLTETRYTENPLSDDQLSTYLKAAAAAALQKLWQQRPADDSGRAGVEE